MRSWTLNFTVRFSKSVVGERNTNFWRIFVVAVHRLLSCKSTLSETVWNYSFPHFPFRRSESISVWEFVRQMEMTTKWNCVWHLTGETDEIKLWFRSPSLAPAGGLSRLIRFIYKFEIKSLWIDNKGASECDALSFRLTDIDAPTSYV